MSGINTVRAVEERTWVSADSPLSRRLCIHSLSDLLLRSAQHVIFHALVMRRTLVRAGDGDEEVEKRHQQVGVQSTMEPDERLIEKRN